MAVLDQPRNYDFIPDYEQIGAIPFGRESEYIIPVEKSLEIEELVIPKFNELVVEDGIPAHLRLGNAVLLLTHHKEYRGKLSRRTHRFSGVEFITRTFQPLRKTRLSHHLVVDAISILEPLNGRYAGYLLGEVHPRPLGNSLIQSKDVRPFDDNEYSLLDRFAKKEAA